MSRRCLTSFALVLALTSAASAQGGDSKWVSVAPNYEDFVVLMPAKPVLVVRALPFGGGSQVEPMSYEAVDGKVRYSVLLFIKGEPTPPTFDAFIDGFRHALLGAENGDYLIDHERDLKLEGRDGKQFVLRTGQPIGTVRAYDDSDCYYVLMSVGGRAGEPAVDKFFSSFTLAARNREAAQITTLDYTPPAEAPASFWPALEQKVFGVMLEERPAAAAGAVDGTPPGGVLNSKVVKSVPPTYPAIAKAARAQGTVVVQITVGVTGEVIAASAVSGHPLLQASAVNAVRQWRFSPYTVDGQPVKVTGTVNVHFVLK
jgi:TonB family protein